MQLRLAAAVTGLILLVLFTFIWRPPQANPATDVPADLVVDAGPELILAPPPEDLATPGSVRKTDRLIQPAVGSTLSPNVDISQPALPIPQAGSTTKVKPLPKPARVPAARPPRPAEAGSVVVRGRGVAAPPPRAVPEAGSVARKPVTPRPAPQIVLLATDLGGRPQSEPTASMTTLARFIAASPGGLQVAVGDTTGEIRLLDVATSSVARTIKITSGALLDLLYTPDGALLATATGQQLLLFDPASGEIVRRYKTSDTYSAIALMPGGEHIIALSQLGRVARVSLTTGEVVVVGDHPRPASALAVSPDGRYAATGSTDGALRIWSLDTPGEPYIAETTTVGFQSLAFTPDARRLVCVGATASIQVWTLQPRALKQERSIKAPQGTNSLHFGRNPGRLYVSGPSAFAYVCDIDALSPTMTPLPEGRPPSTIRDVAMSSDGLMLATLFRDRTVHVVILDPTTSAVQKQLTITAARNP